MKQTQTLKQRVYNEVIDSIVRGQFKAGQILTEQELVARYGVSKSPVREALTVLSSEGILSNIPRYGYQVFSFTLEKVADIMEFRAVLEDYLLCHAAFVMPAAFACYKTDGDLKKLRRNTVYLGRVIDANIEGYRAIRNAGHDILPKADADFESEKYRKTCLRFFKLMCATSLGKLCASDHAMNAIDEMSALNRDIKRFFDENGAAYPVWQALEAEAGRYLR